MPSKRCRRTDDLKDCRDTGKHVPATFQEERRGGFPSWDGRCPTREIKISAGVETTKDEGKSGDAAATPPTGTGGTTSAGRGERRRLDVDVTMGDHPH